MAIRFSTFLKHLPPWFCNEGLEEGVILGTMGRLVRNLKDEPFPGWSTPESRARVAKKLTPIVRSLPGFKQATHAEISELGRQERKLLLERKLITPCLAARQDGCHVFINKKQDSIVMLNEEEHLVIHSFAAGNKVHDIVADLRKKAQTAASKIEFAHSKEYGYLTSMAAESGDGIQLYMVMHLPGHAMLRQMEKLERALNKMQLNLSPFYTEYGEETGHLYVIFTAPTPPDSTDDVATHLVNTVNSLVEKEALLQNKIVAEDPLLFTDAVGRTFGTLSHATLMSYPEQLHTFSLIRMGVEHGVLGYLGNEIQLWIRLSQLLLWAAPTHLEHTSSQEEEIWINHLRSLTLMPLADTLQMQPSFFNPDFLDE